ncbi:MAG TPA: hypothetical protein VGR93_05235 [Candidatus Acidoferrales bacterium]|nr:hypothetical protein [Candidatus Acidoferrales bacterium]
MFLSSASKVNGGMHNFVARPQCGQPMITAFGHGESSPDLTACSAAMTFAK